MGEADNFFNIMLTYEKYKTIFIAVMTGILAFILTIMYISELYDEYKGEKIPEDTNILKIKYMPIVIIALWIATFVMLYLRNNKTYQEFFLFMDVTRR